MVDIMSNIIIYIIISTSVAYVVGLSVNPLQSKETQHVNIVFQFMYWFFEQQNMKGDRAQEQNGNLSSVTTFSTDFSFQNLVFCNLFEFSAAEITSKSITPTFWIQILPNKFHYMPLIKIFPTTLKAHSNSFKIFSYDLI